MPIPMETTRARLVIARDRMHESIAEIEVAITRLNRDELTNPERQYTKDGISRAVYLRDALTEVRTKLLDRAELIDSFIVDLSPDVEQENIHFNFAT
jgi:hypothetical protein